MTPRATFVSINTPQENLMEVTGLKEWIQALVSSGDATQVSIGREAGISGSAISQWLKGNYKGDNDAVENKLERWWESREIRSRAISALPVAPAFVEMPTAERIQSVLNYAQMAGDLAVVYGGAGTGKTTASREYARHHPNVWIATMAPDTCRPQACLEEVAEVVGLRAIHGLSAAKLRREIVKRLVDTNGLLIIDEAQHLTLAALDELRSIQDAVGIGLVLSGNELIYTRMTGGARSQNCAQIFSRIGKRLKLNRPSNGDVSAIMEAFKVTGSEEYKTLSAIASKPGALRGIVKSLRLGSMFAAGAGEPLNLKHIRGAWRDLGGEEA